MREGTDIPFGDVEDSLKFELTLDREVLDGKVVLPVVGQALVECTVLVVCNVLRVTSPDGFRLVELLVGRLLLFDLLLFFSLGLSSSSSTSSIFDSRPPWVAPQPQPHRPRLPVKTVIRY